MSPYRTNTPPAKTKSQRSVGPLLLVKSFFLRVPVPGSIEFWEPSLPERPHYPNSVTPKHKVTFSYLHHGKIFSGCAVRNYSNFIPGTWWVVSFDSLSPERPGIRLVGLSSPGVHMPLEDFSTLLGKEVDQKYREWRLAALQRLL